MIKILRELHSLGSEMKSRSAKTFIFHKGEEIVQKAVTLLKEFAPEKLKEIDTLLEEIRDKADNSGELDDAGSNYLRRYTKLLKHFKLNIAGKEKTLNEKFVPVLDKLLTIPSEIGDGKYNSFRT